MKRNLLYYPTLTFPKTWLYRALFYCDTVSSIYPSSIRATLEEYELLKLLSDEGQYKPADLNHLIYENQKEFQSFGEQFQKIVESEEFKINNDGRQVDVESIDPYFFEKSLYIREETWLFSKYTTRDSTWSRKIDEVISLFYLGSLAQFISEHDSYDFTIPSTGDKRYQNIVYKLPDKHVSSFNLIFQNCLPVPDTSVDLKKIIDFKRNRYQQLLEFRNLISEFQEQMAKAENEFHVKQIQMECIEKIKSNILILERLSKESKIITTLTSFESLLGAESPKLFNALTLAGAITTGFSPAAGITTGLLGLTGSMVSTYIKRKQEISSSKFSYLFLAHQDKNMPLRYITQ